MLYLLAYNALVLDIGRGLPINLIVGRIVQRLHGRVRGRAYFWVIFICWEPAGQTRREHGASHAFGGEARNEVHATRRDKPRAPPKSINNPAKSINTFSGARVGWRAACVATEQVWE